MIRFVQRALLPRLEYALSERRVTLLTGARQCGKTTLARHLVRDSFEYRTLDDKSMREAAEFDPVTFVQSEKHTLIIDEIQRVPDLLPAIKEAVDTNPAPGQYLLTGSVDIRSSPSTRESLAGRITRVRLRTLSQNEISSRQLPRSDEVLAGLFNGNTPQPASHFSRNDIIEIGFRGGYPEGIDLSRDARRRWHMDYIKALLDRDLREITRIHRADAMRKLTQVLAAWSSRVMDIAKITDQLSIKRQTVESYLNALEALYIAERVPSWTATDYARVAGKDKLFMSDCGLMTSILTWNIDQMRFDSDRSGKLFKTIAFTELSSLVESTGTHSLYHYRDWEQREIDFLVEDESTGNLLGVEVKASRSVGARDFQHLVWFRDNIAQERSFTGIVLYSGDTIIEFGPHFRALPFGILWDS